MDSSFKKITNGNYKFWLSNGRKGWPLFFYYYDTNGKFKVFEINPDEGFRVYDGFDNITLEKWKLINDSVMEESGFLLNIECLTKDIMIRRTPAGSYDTLYAAPDSMIPKEFRHRW